MTGVKVSHARIDCFLNCNSNLHKLEDNSTSKIIRRKLFHAENDWKMIKKKSTLKMIGKKYCKSFLNSLSNVNFSRFLHFTYIFFIHFRKDFLFSLIHFSSIGDYSALDKLSNIEFFLCIFAIFYEKKIIN